MRDKRRGGTRQRAVWEKRVDETLHLTRKRGGVLKEEVWYAAGKVVKYSLAYLNPAICTADHGRVLGYDNQHGVHHRHYVGKVTSFEFAGYEALAERFQREVEDIWRSEHEKRR